MAAGEAAVVQDPDALDDGGQVPVPLVEAVLAIKGGRRRFRDVEGLVSLGEADVAPVVAMLFPLAAELHGDEAPRQYAAAAANPRHRAGDAVLLDSWLEIVAE